MTPPSPRRLARADEGADELTVHGGRDGPRIDALTVEELAGVLPPVDPSPLAVDRLEPGPGELLPVLLVLPRPRDAVHPQLDALAGLGRERSADHDVRD